MENDFHGVKAAAVAGGYQATCTCGWRGVIRERQFDRYAWTNARNEGAEHFKEIERQRALSAETRLPTESGG